MKVNIREQIPKYLGEVKLLTTKCCIQEVEKLGPSLFGATTILKQFALHKCGHDDNPLPAVDCIKSMIGKDNKSRYIVASNDGTLRGELREVPGVPLIYLHTSAPTLEKPSNVSLRHVDKVNSDKTNGGTGSDYYFKTAAKLKKEMFGEPEQKVYKRKKIKGPNPLSCKKKKKKTLDPLRKPKIKMETTSKKRKRNRRRQINSE